MHLSVIAGEVNSGSNFPLVSFIRFEFVCLGKDKPSFDLKNPPLPYLATFNIINASSKIDFVGKSNHNYMYVQLFLIFYITFQEYQVAYVIIKTGNAPRPGTWALEKSVDGGKTFTPWQYFATDNSDCLTYFGHSALLQSFKDDTTVTCTTSYSQVPPFENGEVSTRDSLFNSFQYFFALLFCRIYSKCKMYATMLTTTVLYMFQTHLILLKLNPRSTLP